MKKQGFTLIELLVAIAIMAVIMALAFPNYLSARERARDTKLKAEMNGLKNALRLYYNDYQRYPAVGIGAASGKIAGCGTDGTEDCPNTGTCASYEFSAGGTSGCDMIYMKKMPVSTANSGEMRYVQTSNDGFSICAFLENLSDADGAASITKCTLTVSVSGSPKNPYCVCAD